MDDAPVPLGAPIPGARITTAYVGREMKAYAIVEGEVRTISMMNGLATVFFSAATMFLGFAIGIWTNAAFYETLNPEGKILAHVVAPVLCGMTVLGVILGFWALRNRGTTWDAIRRESKTEP